MSVSGHAAFQCRLKGSESLVICLWLPQHTMSTAIMIEVSLKDHITTTGGLLELENTSNSSINGECKNKCRPTGCKAATRADGCRCDRHPPGWLQDSPARHTHSREELGYIRRASFTSIAQGKHIDTVLFIIKLTKFPVPVRLCYGSGKLIFVILSCFAIFKNVVHSLESGTRRLTRLQTMCYVLKY